MSELLLSSAGLGDVPDGEGNHPEETQFVTFSVGERYGVPVRQVHEVIRVGNITEIPNSPPYVEGVINHRGRILPVLNLRKRLSLPFKEVTKASRIVVTESGDRTIGLLVDAVAHVTELSAGYVEKVPADVLDIGADCITGLCKLEEGLTILLDLEKLLLRKKDGCERGRE